MATKQTKQKPPFEGRKLGQRCVKGLTPPFHPKDKEVSEYKSYFDTTKNKRN